MRTAISSRKFVAEIRKQVLRGFSVSPFLGSGMSSPSGILMGQDFDNYLAHSVCKVLRTGWDIRQQGWPELPSQAEHVNNCKYVLEQFQRISGDLGIEVHLNDGQIVGFGAKFEAKDEKELKQQSNVMIRPLAPRILRKSAAVERQDRQRLVAAQRQDQLDSLLKPSSNPNLSPTSSAYVEETGIRHLFDWRATLEFLASVKIRRRSHGDEGMLSMGAFDSSVIDSFNRQITAGRKPNLGHKMLAHLSRPLRSRFILTTNFDNLIEQALNSIGIEAQVLDVRTGGEIPAPFTVRAENSVVKLHGSLVETRADFTLDKTPSQTDLERLAEIVLGYPNQSGTRSVAQGYRQHIGAHLLVLGYSGRDRRCILMLKYILDTDPDFHLYWVCYDQRDVEHLEEVFREDEYDKRITIVKTRRPDLLLYELYQELTFCLPAGGFAYEFAHKIPPQPYEEEDDDHAYKATQSQTELSDLLLKKIRSGKHPRKPKQTDCKDCLPIERFTDREGLMRLYAQPLNEDLQANEEDFLDETSVLIFDVETNAIKIANLAFEDLRNQGKVCMWLEMQDHPNPRYLADDLFRTLALWRGFHQIENLRYSVQLAFEKDSQKSTDKQPKDEAATEKELHRVADLLPHFQNLLDYMGYGHKDNEDDRYTTDIVVFLYGRNVPGGCAAWGGVPWKEQQYRELALLLEVLNQCGIKVLYMPFTDARQQRELEKQTHDISRLKTELRGQLELHKMAVKDTECEEWGNLYKPLLQDFEKNGLGTLGESVDAINTTPTPADTPRRETRSFYNTLNSLINNFFSVAPDQAQSDSQSERPIGDSDFDVDTIDRRFLFLYAVTLFRQSRHVSAFLSEAVFRCPFRFRGHLESTERIKISQLKGSRSDDELDAQTQTQIGKQKRVLDKLADASLMPIENISSDNDLTRKCITDLWIGILRSNGAFLYKAGSYVWKYRDVRLGLRALVDSNFQISFNAITDDTIGNPEEAGRWVEYPGQLRSRTHLWIADWYRNAFFATGHAHPLIESVHHYMQAIIYARVAKPTHQKTKEEYNGYRRVLAASACNELRKLIRIAAPWIPLWIHVHESDPFFSHDTSVRGTIQKLIEQHEAIRNQDPWAEFLIQHLKDVQKDIRLLGAVLRESSQIFSLLTGPTTDSRRQTIINGDPESFTSSTFLGKHSEWQDTLDALLPKWKSCFLEQDGASADEQDGPAAEFFGILEKLVSQILEINDPAEDLDAVTERLNKTIKEHYHDLMAESVEHEQRALELANALSELGYALIKRSKLEVFADEKPSQLTGHAWQAPERRVKLMQACCLFHLAWRFLYLTPPEHIGTEIELRVKNDSLYGLALGYLDRPFEAHRHLNQAMALLSKTQAGLDGIQLAMIRLRRAELFMCFAKNLRRRLELELKSKERGSDDWKKNFRDLCRQFYATLDDSVAHLDYAEDTLSGIGHSNLWWGRCLSLQLRAYSVLPNRKLADEFVESSYEPLLYRKRTQHDATVRTLFRRLLNTTTHDEYRRLRALDYYVRAMLERYDDPDFSVKETDIELATNAVESIHVSKFKLLQKNLNNIKTRLTKLKRMVGKQD